MGALNLYKIDSSKKQIFIQELSNKMNRSKVISIPEDDNGIDEDFDLTLFFSQTSEPKSIKWNWLLERYGENEVQVDTSPSAVLLIEREDRPTYAATFGHSFFIVDKFADQDFGFDFARKIPFSEVKTTTLTTPNSKRNKTVNTYIDYNVLEFDSGESFAKLKAKAELSDDFSLFKPSLEIGTSIRFVTENDTLEQIVSIICYIEKVLQNSKNEYKIPVFSKVKDKDLIFQLNTRMEEKVRENPEVSISELDIIGATEIFNHNDGEFIIKCGEKTRL